MAGTLERASLPRATATAASHAAELLPRLAFTAGLLGLVGASLGLLAGTIALTTGPELGTFVAKNTLAPPTRQMLLACLLIGGVLAPLPAVLYVFFGRKRAIASIDAVARFADLVGPLAVLGLLPPLALFHPWADAPLTFLVLLSMTGLVLEQLFRRALGSLDPAMWDELGARTEGLRAIAGKLALPSVLVLAVGYAIYFSYFTILHHHRLGTAAFDLGINVNWSYNALKGQWWRSPVLFGADGGHFLGNHAIFALFFWLPFFAISPTAEMFLVYQSVMAAAGGVALFLFARTLLPRGAAFVITLAYFFYAPLHEPNFYDCHELLLALPWHFAMYWAISTRRYRWIWLFLPGLLAHKEDLPVGVTMLGAFLTFTGTRPRLGLVLATSAVSYFVIMKFKIMPSYQKWWFSNIYKDLQSEGAQGYGGAVQTILINPAYFLSTLLKEDKLVYFLHIFAPIAFLPLRRPALAFVAMPGFFFTLMTTAYAPTLAISFQYTAHWIPYVFGASVLMLHLVGRTSRGFIDRAAVLGTVVVMVTMHSYVFGAVLQRHTMKGGFSHIEFQMSDEEKARYAVVKRLSASIPREASVSASENLVPHIGARMDAYTSRGSVTPADYVFLWQPQMGADSRKSFQTLMETTPYGLVDEGHGVYLFKRNFDSPKTADAKKALGL